MKKPVFFLMVLVACFVAACSKSSPDAAAGKTEAAAMPPDYKKICEHLVPLAPVERRDTFASSCETTYRGYLPACQNAAAVTDCFANIKSWDQRLACLDSCQRELPAKLKPVS